MVVIDLGKANVAAVGASVVLISTKSVMEMISESVVVAGSVGAMVPLIIMAVEYCGRGRTSMVKVNGPGP